MTKKVKKIKLTLTVTPDEREYLEVIAKEKGLSISQFVGIVATKEYKRIQRAEKKKRKNESR